MKQIIRAIGAGMLALGIVSTAGIARADDKVTLGVAIPTADTASRAASSGGPTRRRPILRKNIRI